MLTPKADDETRHKLFCTRCTINQWIFDNGSCENIIGRETAVKLSLNIKKYPKPYTIGSIKKGTKIIVTERCKVSFSIGKYKYEVYCDVVDMNTCNLLFGRPWQYNVNAWYGGQENIYRFDNDEISFTSMPLKGNSQPKPCKAGGKVFFTNNQSLSEIETF